MRSDSPQESIIHIRIQFIFEQRCLLYGCIDDMPVSFVRQHDGTYMVQARFVLKVMPPQISSKAVTSRAH